MGEAQEGGVGAHADMIAKTIAKLRPDAQRAAGDAAIQVAGGGLRGSRGGGEGQCRDRSHGGYGETDTHKFP